MSVATQSIPRTRAIPALPTLAPRQLLPFPSHPLPFPLATSHRYYLARTALFHGLRRFTFPAGAVCLMPAYHHGVEVETVRAAGLEVRFYPIGRRMDLRLDEFERRLTPEVRALYVTHFAGFPAPIAACRALAERKGVLLVEDCALALLSRDDAGTPLGRSGDLSIFCLYKSLPVPHGGVLVSTLPPESATESPPLPATLSHLCGSILRHAELEQARSAEALLLARRAFRGVGPARRVPTGGQHLVARELTLGASRLLDLILHSLDYGEIVAARRANYTRLLEALGDDRAVPTGALPPNACPLFLPLAVPDRDRALEHLWQNGIAAIDLWRTGVMESDEPADVAWLRRHVIEVPCHQDLDAETVDFVAARAKEVLAS